jgi:prepilin-type N-terminal cleavage/methylation domain-containing protein
VRNKRSIESASDGFSLIELLIVVTIILIIAAIAIPNLLRSRMAANQSSAAANLRTITTASTSYSVTYSNGYPPSLAALGGTGTATCDAAILIDETLAVAPYQKSGYTFAYTGNQGNIANAPANCGAPGFNGYLVTATPISLGVTGDISFCSGETGIIHYDPQGMTPADENACAALPPLQ